ncbi:MAG TPA: hypothetical protein VHN77_07065 [Phycisphaerales bacterium]|nr:hypothetical protein [Phycisphaerales bacterium]
MIADAIRERLSKDPFKPFHVRTSGGQAYKVADPSLVVMMKSQVFIAEPRSDRAVTIPYLHVAAVGHSDGESGNGHGHGRHASGPRRRK